MKPALEFEIYRDDKREWRWRAIAKNTKIMADSGEGYKLKYSCKKSIERIITVIQSGDVKR